MCAGKLHRLKLGIKGKEYVKYIEGSIELGIIRGGRTKIIPDVGDQETIAGRSTGEQIRSVCQGGGLCPVHLHCTVDAFWGSQVKLVLSIVMTKKTFSSIFAFVITRPIPDWSLYQGGI